jgi:hypothetical protein
MADEFQDGADDLRRRLYGDEGSGPGSDPLLIERVETIKSEIEEACQQFSDDATVHDVMRGMLAGRLEHHIKDEAPFIAAKQRPNTRHRITSELFGTDGSTKSLTTSQVMGLWQWVGEGGLRLPGDVGALVRYVLGRQLGQRSFFDE